MNDLLSIVALPERHSPALIDVERKPDGALQRVDKGSQAIFDALYIDMFSNTAIANAVTLHAWARDHGRTRPDFLRGTPYLSGLPAVDLLSRITNRKAAAARTLFFCLWRCSAAGVNQNQRNVILVQVLVRDNNVDQALRALKKKMQREGIFREMKMRDYYEKPSQKRAREKAEAVRRVRKLARKRAQREGLVAR
jgi:ribosomal protein S21